MLQGALIKLSSYKKFLQKWLDSVYSCTRNASPKMNMDCR